MQSYPSIDAFIKQEKLNELNRLHRFLNNSLTLSLSFERIFLLLPYEKLPRS